MNKLEIFQAVYGKDYVFTETELSRLLKVTELIVRECADIADGLLEDNTGSEVMFRIKEHFGVGL
jgi:hypothetical protein